MINLITSSCNLPHKNPTFRSHQHFDDVKSCEQIPCRDAVAPPHGESSSGACILWLVDPWYSIVRLRDGCENLPYLNPKITAKELRQKQLDRSYDDNRHCWQKATLNTWCDNLWIGCSGSSGWSDTLENLSNWGTEIRAKRHYSVRNIRIIVWRLLQRDTSLYAKLENMKNCCHKFSAVKAR